MTLLSTVCRFLIPAKQVGYLPGSTLSNDTNFIELKRSVDRMEDLTASLFYNPNSPSDHVTWSDIFVVSANTKPLLYSKNCGLPFLTDRSGINTRSIILLLPHNICDLILTSYQNVQFICTLAATPRSLPTQPVTPRSMVIGLLPGFTCQPSSSMPLLPFTLGLGASPLTL